MKQLIYISILTLSVLKVEAQEFDIISLKEFESIEFNNLRTLKQLIDNDNYESLLEQLFGVPNSKECYPNPMTGNGCDIFYDGFELGFDYNTILLELTLTGSSNYFYYNGNELKPGMSLFDIKSIFPKSYDNRYSIDGEEYYIRVDVAYKNSGTNFLFEYNPNLNIITEISLGLAGEQ